MADWPACGGSGGGNSGTIIVEYNSTVGAFDSTALIPAGARAWLDNEITGDFDGDASILVGTPSLPNLFADSTISDIDPAVIDLYHIPQTTLVAVAEPLRVTVGGTPTQGTGYALLYWSVPEI